MSSNNDWVDITPGPQLSRIALAEFIKKEAARQGVDPALAARVMSAESTGNNSAVSPKGAIGAMQVMPATFREMGGKNINDPQENIQAGIRYLRENLARFGGDSSKAVAAYNAGPGAVARYGGVPPYPETQKYVAKVVGSTMPQAKESRTADSGNDADWVDVPQKQALPVKKQEAPGFLESMLFEAYKGGASIDQMLTKLNPFASPEDKARVAASLNAIKGFEGRGTSVQGQIGSLVGNVALGAAMGPAKTIKGAMAIGAALGALQPAKDDDLIAEKSRQIGIGAAGGAAGNLAGGLLGKIISQRAAPNPVGIEAAKRLGYKLTTGQEAGSVPLQRFEEALAGIPGAMGKASRMRVDNQALLNSKAARSIGENSDLLTGEVYQAAKDRISDTFKDLFPAELKVKFGPDFADTASRIAQENAALGPFANKEVGEEAVKALKLSELGEMNGPAYQRLRTRLAKRANVMLRGDSQNPEVGNALKDLLYALDNEADKALTPPGQVMLDKARKELSNYKVLTRGNATMNGDVSPASVRAALQTVKGDIYKRGAADPTLTDIANLARQFSMKEPNSGTAQRTWVQGVMDAPLAHTVTVAASNALQNVLESRPVRAYMTKGLLNGAEVPQEVLNYLRATGGLLGADTALKYTR